MSQPPIVHLDAVSKSYGPFHALHPLSLTIPRGRMVALLGRSGSGKSTLLNLLGAVDTPTTGTLLVDNQNLSAMTPHQLALFRRRSLGFVFQSFHLLPSLTVFDNIAVPFTLDRALTAARKKEIHALLERLDLSTKAHSYPDQLSGGQQQRVALARSLVKRPKVLLLDEPMSALDKKIRQKTQLELVNIIEKVDVTCVMVTHDQEEAMTMASRLAVMSEGRIVQIGSPSEVYEFPNSRFAAEFIGSTNLFEGRVVKDEPDHVFVESDDLEAHMYVSHGITGPLGMSVGISVRPERVSVTRDKPGTPHNWARGVVTDVAYMGSYSLYHVRLPGGKVVVSNLSSSQLMNEGAPAWNEDVYVSWSPASGVVLTQ